MRKYNIIFLLMILMLHICPQTCYCKNKEDNMIITAKIISYHTSALIADYDDGSFEHFDATKMIIIKPEKYAGKEFYLYHQYPRNKSSFWNMKSAVITLALNESIDDNLFDSSEIYSEGVDVYFVEISSDKKIEQPYKSSVFFEPVKTSFIYTHGGEAPLINHAGLSITNQAKQSLSLTIDRIDFISNTYSIDNPKKLDISRIKIKSENIDNKKDTYNKIEIEAGKNVTADVFFKGFEYSPAAYDDTYVLIYITCRKRQYLVKSDINIIRKEPWNKKL